MAYEGVGANRSRLNTNGITNSFNLDVLGLVENSVSGAYSVSANDTTKIILHSASGVTDYTLPTASEGKVYDFIHYGPMSDQEQRNFMRIHPNTGDEIRYGSNLVEPSGYVEVSRKGLAIRFVCLDSTTWIVTQSSVTTPYKNMNSSDSLSDVSFIGRQTWTSKTSGSGTARSEMEPVGLLGYSFGIGGTTALITPTSATTAYRRTTDSWITKGNLNTARYTNANFPLHEKIYAANGQVPGALNSIEEYNFFTDAWSNKSGTGGTARGGVGGFSSNGHGFICNGGTNSTEVNRYEPIADASVSVTVTTQGKAQASYCAFMGMLYSTGGFHTVNGALSYVEEYIYSANEWVRRQSMPNVKNLGWGVSHNSYYYTTGGWDDSVVLSTTYRLNFFSGEWSTDPGNLTAAQANGGGGKTNGYWNIAYGENSGGTRITTNQEFN